MATGNYLVRHSLRIHQVIGQGELELANWLPGLETPPWGNAEN